MSQFETVEFIYPVRFNPSLTPTVQKDQKIHADTVIAEGQLKSEQEIDLASKLDLKDVTEFVEVEVGDSLAENQLIAARKTFRTHKEVLSPIAGVVSDLSETHITIQTSTGSQQITTPLTGKVQDIESGKISIITSCDRIVGTSSYGHAGYGPIHIPDINDDVDTRLNWLGYAAASSVLTISKPLTPDVWYKAATLNVSCILCTQLPTNFDSFILSDDLMYPAVIVIGDESGMIDPKLWKGICKLEGKRCFFIPSANQVLIPKA